MERAHVLYTGRVQGVGFRWRTLRCAQGLDVSGFVRNLPDGSVELTVEGASSAIDALLAAVRDEMGGLIRTERVDRGPARGGLGPFTIER